MCGRTHSRQQPYAQNRRFKQTVHLEILPPVIDKIYRCIGLHCDANDNCASHKCKLFIWGAKAEVYAAAVRKAADSLVAERLLLPEDATRLIAEADSKGVRAGP